MQHKAEQIADLLGYLPLALAQAAAFVKKMALSLTVFLGRLKADLSRYVSSPFPPYKAGVYSCWEMSVKALMESTPHAFDLLRVCSYLSPDGISRELLCRGLAVMDWFQNGKCNNFTRERSSTTSALSHKRHCQSLFYFIPFVPQV